VQLSRIGTTAVLTGALCIVHAMDACAIALPDEQTVGYMLRYFGDSDHVTVRSSVGDYAMTLDHGVGLSIHWNNERVVIPAIKAPVGSQQAIDAITTASRPISGNAYNDFIKVRNEFQGGVRRGGTALDYYLSSESDYLGQQVAASYDHDVTEQLNLSVGTSYGWDAIEPLADDDTQTATSHKTTLHWNAVATQILTPTTLVRLGLEYNMVNGLQHNPYRNVYAGGTNVPERHPDHRERRDAFVKLNQYVSNRSSIKLNYRYYNDDWGIDSHELDARLNQYITQGVFAGYQYRYYTQTPAKFYRPEYILVTGIDGYRTGDYRMAALASHLFGAKLNMDLDAIAAEHALLRRLGLWVDYERYFNSNNYSADIFETGLDFRF
jgi:Protein of unknown function (DUF3570)